MHCRRMAEVVVLSRFESSKPILVPVDFEDASLAALDTALELARKLEGRLILLHVRPLPIAAYPYPGISPYMFPALDTELEAAAKRSLDDLGERYGIADRMLR